MNFSFLKTVLIICFGFCLPALSSAGEGIQKYYLRYDVKTVSNTIIGENLLMVPAENEFRAENFSQFTMDGAIFSSSGTDQETLKQQIQQKILKSLLRRHGLKSVDVKDKQTVVSYEGLVITPLKISFQDQAKDIYTYKGVVHFSPLAFPDKWEWMGIKQSVKNVFHDFFQLFQ